MTVILEESFIENVLKAAMAQNDYDYARITTLHSEGTLSQEYVTFSYDNLRIFIAKMSSNKINTTPITIDLFPLNLFSEKLLAISESADKILGGKAKIILH